MKKLIILGGTGFIGECFIDFFLKKKLKTFKLSKIILVGRNIHKIKKKYNLKKSNIILKQIDLNNNIKKLPKADFVLHAAENYNNLNNKSLNYYGSYNLTKKICNYYNSDNFFSKLIFISSGSVYGNNFKKIKISEKQKVNKNIIKQLPKTKRNYAFNKFRSENYIKKTFNKNYEIIRLFSVLSKHVPQESNYVIGNFIKDTKRNDKIIINSSKPRHVFRSFIDSDDLIKIIIKLFFLQNKNNSIYNFGSDEYVNIFNLAKLFSYYSKKKINYKKMQKNEKNKLDFYVPNIKKITKVLRIKKINSLNKSIIKCLK